MATPATLPSGETPGCKVKKVAASRLMLGSESKALPRSCYPLSRSDVWSSAFVAVTSTLSATEPTSSETLRVRAEPTFTVWPVSLEMRNPCLLTVKS